LEWQETLKVCYEFENNASMNSIVTQDANEDDDIIDETETPLEVNEASFLKQPYYLL
jgi:hypothetical protein